MSFIGDAMKTIESVVLLRSKIERLEAELERTNRDSRRLLEMLAQMNSRLVRVETIIEIAREGGLPRLGQ